MTTIMHRILLILFATALAAILSASEPGCIIVQAAEEFPRNGESSMVALKDASHDAGKTWSEPKTLLEGKEGALWHDYPAILWHERKLHLATRHIEIFNTNKWTNVSLHWLTLSVSHFTSPASDD